MDDVQVKASLEKTLELGPAHPGSMTELSERIADSDPQRAMDLLRRSVALDPSAGNYYRAAVLQKRIGNYKAAIASIKMAIALQHDQAGYYEERERIEAALGVDEVERKRHLADGYREIGDSLLKQGKNVEAYQSYQRAADVLTPIAGKDRSGAAANELAAVKSRFARVLENNVERVSGRILALRGDGKTREVTIDRGHDDGVVAGDEGTLWTIYSKTIIKSARCRRLARQSSQRRDAIQPRSQVTMDDPTGDKLVRVGDMVEVSMRVPPLGDRPNLWGLTKFHIALTSEDGKKVFADYRMLYQDASAETVNRVLDEIAAEIRSTARPAFQPMT